MIIDLQMIGMLVADLNVELKYKSGDYIEGGIQEDLLALMTNGEDHQLIFCGCLIWSSLQEAALEPEFHLGIQAKKNFNEREKFEAHVRILIQDKINILKNLEV